MRVVPCVVLMAVCLGSIGCHSLAKRPQGATPPVARAPSDPRPDLPDRVPAGTPTALNGTTADYNGILAGQVLDPGSGRPPLTSIQVCEATATPATPARQAECDGQGYFTVKGLQPGRHYQVTARAKNGDRVLIGTAFATPPDARILIQLSDTPAAGAAPAMVAAVPTAPEATAVGVSVPASPAPANNALGSAAQLGAPHAYIPPPAPTVPIRQEVPARPENIATGPFAVRPDPQVAIPRQGPGPIPQPAPAVGLPRDGAATPVPSCQLIGNTCYNFALRDLSGRPWEYRAHRSKLVLIDFWGTWCHYCVQGIPNLKTLQSYYGNYGLQVIGIAYEDQDRPIQDQVRSVQRIQRIKEVNYLLLLGSGDRCPVKTQFQVKSFPTAVLLDEQGHIIWRYDQEPDRNKLAELEIIIRQRLGIR